MLVLITNLFIIRNRTNYVWLKILWIGINTAGTGGIGEKNSVVTGLSWINMTSCYHGSSQK